MAALGVVGFVVALLVSVVLHEAGHFATAKRYGMKATQFFVGFGPTLWSRQKGETEYGLKAIPAGGYVKIVGMTELEEVAPEDEPRAFYRFPARRRAVVLVAGSLTHIVLAVVLIWLSLWVAGEPDTHRVRVATVQGCLQAANDGSCAGQAASPAKAAGLQLSDEIQTVNGQKITDSSDIRNILAATNGAPVTITYTRDGHPGSVVVKPSQTKDENGKPVYRIGIATDNPQKSVGPLEAVTKVPSTFGQFVTGTASALAHFPSKLSTIFSNNRDPEGAVGVVGISRVSGDILSLPGDPLSVRIGAFLLLVAGVNFFVGIFNLLPLLPLDGGHLAVLGYEQARDRVRRARGYRGPLQRVDLNKLLPATYAVVAVFLTITVLLAAADIVNPVHVTP